VTTIASLSERPDLVDRSPFGPGWPKFIFHDPVAARLMPTVERLFADHNLVLLDKEDEVVAGGWGVPIVWDGNVDGLPSGWDGALERSISGHNDGEAPNTLCAMATEVVAGHRGVGLASEVLQGLRRSADPHGLERMIAPARPTLKHRYPLIAIERYAEWTRDDGSPFDPWLRTHWRLGARVLACETRAMRIAGTIADWEEWIGMALPDSGEYIVPQALVPITVDRVRNEAVYDEPAVWMLHP
jgi:hypothetical protein